MKTTIVTLLIILLPCISCAKKYKYEYSSPRTVNICRSGGDGTKIVEVEAIAGNADKAIEKAMLDAVLSASFNGLSGSATFGSVPPIVENPDSSYQIHQVYFDDFFKKGKFLNFVRNANSSYPSGSNNVSTPKGRKVKVVLILDWKALASEYKSHDIPTVLDELTNF